LYLHLAHHIQKASACWVQLAPVVLSCCLPKAQRLLSAGAACASWQHAVPAALGLAADSLGSISYNKLLMWKTLLLGVKQLLCKLFLTGT